jgi:hypothetical protein
MICKTCEENLARGNTSLCVAHAADAIARILAKQEAHRIAHPALTNAERVARAQSRMAKRNSR